jgi:hypothetical protein
MYYITLHYNTLQFKAEHITDFRGEEKYLLLVIRYTSVHSLIPFC